MHSNPRRFDRAEFKRIALDSSSTAQVCQRTGLHKATVYKLLDELRLPTYGRVYERQVDYDEVSNLLSAGVSHGEIARRFGTTPNYVSKIASRLRIAKPNRVYTQEDYESVEALLDDGVSYAEIERTLDVSYTWLRRHFPGRGWTPAQSAEYRALIRRLKPSELTRMGGP